MQLYLFNIRPKLHHRRWRKLQVPNFFHFTSSLLCCWCCSSSNLNPETLL